MSVSLLASMHCNKDAEGAFNMELKKMIDASKHDAGFISCELYQFKDEPVKYVTKEKWETEDALNRHMETPHYKHFVRILPALLHTPAEIKILTRLL